MIKQYKNKEWLKEKYLKEKLSLSEINKVCEISGHSTISNWLKKFNIPRRSVSEAKHLGQANHCNLSPKAINWINGELLGDGCLISRSKYSAEFYYGSKHLEYIQYVSDSLKSFGIKQVGKIRKYYHKNLDCFSYGYCSKSYVELLPIHKQWYPEGKKIVPKDIELTSLTARQWYIGDGCLAHSNKKGRRPYIKLHTNNFAIYDVKWLIKQLKKLNFKVTRRESDNVISVSTYSTKDFLKYINKCPTKCYQYKWTY